MHFDTKQIHAGFRLDEATGARVAPLYQTASYYFKNSEHARRLFGLEESGNIYTRIGNPTNAVLEDRVSQLEGGVAGLAVSSGHAAQLVAIVTIAGVGDNIISSPFLYGGTHNQFKVTLRNFGIDARFATDLSASVLEALIDEKTKAIYVESIGNPSFRVPDFGLLASVANAHGIPLIVDNTFGAGGYFCQPFKHGAHIITHSATKWIGGHGTSMGGLVIDGGQFNWDSKKFPLLSSPSEGYHGLNFSEKFGHLAFIARARAEVLRDLGPVQSPFNSFLLLQGLETLSLRAERQASNAMRLAKWLEANAKVESVSYPGLVSHPTHIEANKYLTHGYGCVLSFNAKGGLVEASVIIDRLKLASHMANVGDNRTLVIQPATTTHQQLGVHEQMLAGVEQNEIRVSVGAEYIDDIINDFDQAIC